ncbi:HARBI1 [Mytilus coruscus]|uniref:HARBI1 n=1 Tax=Mytilus coruscus TaxID=42192 RepID=A0A6J8D4M2_MYTCO|nr:HARBI1 [Mytilus coruscus]
MAALARFHVPVQRKERTFRSKEELTIDYTNTELRTRYRFGREGISFLSNLVRDQLSRQTNRNHALSVEQQLMVTLRFLAGGSSLQVIGDTLGRFTNINANWPGCCHDSHVFRTSQIRMDPKKVTKIVMVCAILHNICIQLYEPDVAAEEPVNEDVENGINYNEQQDGRGIREHIAGTYFNRH